MAKFRQGFYKAQYPEKYEGDVTNVVYRSGWELTMMRFCDTNKSILKWSSETVIIPYRNPLTGRNHRYFPDFKVKKLNEDGSTSTLLVEIKPHKETMPPDRAKGMLKTGKPSKRYIAEATTYMKNDAKWNAARAYCAARGWTFVIIDEYGLGLKKRPNS